MKPLYDGLAHTLNAEEIVMYWEPIDTAPRDGSRILIHTNDVAEPVTIAYFSMAECRFIAPLIPEIDRIFQWAPLLVPPIVCSISGDPFSKDEPSLIDWSKKIEEFGRLDR